MALYLRKAFKKGPIRLNLSKGGLGLSGGITGARLGINSKGVYVHGGRHGLYYRKYARKGTKNNSGYNNDLLSTNRNVTSNATYIFVNTGVTYKSKTNEYRHSTLESPVLPSSNVLTPTLKIAFWVIGFVFFASFFSNFDYLLPISLLLTIFTFGWISKENYWKNKTYHLLNQIVDEVTDKKLFPSDIILSNKSLPSNWENWLSLHAHAIISEMAIRNEDIDTLSTLSALDSQFPLDVELVLEIRASVVGNLLDEMLEDYMISVQEEQALLKLIELLKLPDSLISSEKLRIKHFRDLRIEIEKPLGEIKVDFPLLRGELAYAVIDESRILIERVLNRYQRNNIQYRELGYEIELEGRLLLTNRRLLVVGRGTQEYRINNIIDVTTDPEGGCVEINLSNRKSPLLISVKEPLILSAKIDHVINLKSTS